MAFSLYLVFMVSWFLHLPARLPFLGLVRFDMLLLVSIAALTIVARATSDAPVPVTKPARWLFILIGYVLLTVPFVEWPGSVVRFGIPGFLKGVVFYFFTAHLVRTPRQLKLIIATFVGCQVFRVCEPTYLHLTSGYWGSAASMDGGSQFMNRLSGAPYDVVNPNGLAFVVLTILPFLHYVVPLSRAGRLFYVVALPVLMYTLVLTGSRTGLIGLATIVGAVWLKSGQKILVGTLVMVVVAASLPWLSADLADRYRSIVSTETRNSGTATARLESLRLDIAVALRRPLVGHGLGTSGEANANFRSRARPSHNLYAETAQELGFMGLAIVCMFIYSVITALTRLRKHYGLQSGPSAVPEATVSALQVFIAMNLVVSLATYGLSNYHWYLVAGLVESLSRMRVPDSPGVRPPLGAFETTARSIPVTS